jgi:hypothetical protein
MIENLSGLPVHTVGFKLSGKLHDEDYKNFVLSWTQKLPRRKR